MSPRGIKRIIASVVILILLLIAQPWGTCPAGHRGVHLRFSAVTGRIIDPGFYWKAPFIDRVKYIDTRQTKHQIDVSCYTSDTQTVLARIALNYHLEPTAVGTVYEEIGYTKSADDKRSVQSKVIDPKLEDLMKAATPNYDADNIIASRNEIRDRVRASLIEYLQDYHIAIDSFSLVNFQFLKEYEKSIEEKRIAYQDFLKAQHQLEETRVRAQEKIVDAEAEAERIRIQAKSISSQGGKEYVALKAVEKWDGKLPDTMVPGSTLPFIKVGVTE